MPITLNTIAFTDGSDIVDGNLSSPVEGLLVARASSVDTKDGNDKLYGKSDDSSAYYPEYWGSTTRVGVLLQNNLYTSGGNDSVIGNASSNSNVTWIYGVTGGFNGDTVLLDTGWGNDEVQGTAHSGGNCNFAAGITFLYGSTINTGVGGPGNPNRGNDTITGEASGYARYGMWGILLVDSRIITNEGNDSVSGSATALNSPAGFGYRAAGIGLYGSSRIETGSGNDKVTAYATVNSGQRVNGFSGGGTVDLGDDNDILEGFGDMIAHGGSGKDKWILSSYNSTDFTIVKGDTNQLAATFTGFGATSTIDGFEEFVFADGTFSYASLA